MIEHIITVIGGLVLGWIIGRQNSKMNKLDAVNKYLRKEIETLNSWVNELSHKIHILDINFKDHNATLNSISRKSKPKTEKATSSVVVLTEKE